MKTSQVNWANVLTWIRLLAIVPISMLFVAQEFTLGLFVYLLAIITDLFDGYVARLQGTASPKGAAFDGAVDNIFGLVSLWWIWIIAPQFYQQFWYFVLLPIIGFAMYHYVAFAKTKKMLFLHMWSGKLAAALLMLFIPVTILWGVLPWYFHFVWISLVIASIEETLYVLQGGRDPDTKSAFF